ncbi:MAG: hypothetical protein U9R08_03155 [Nanoarchaeota archaeon]|nr:hypothetical protein [Nanoarchaeota archaeon]
MVIEFLKNAYRSIMCYGMNPRDRAYWTLKQEISGHNLNTWPVREEANNPYWMGVTLNWSPDITKDGNCEITPNQKTNIGIEVQKVKSASEKVANSFGLESMVDGPVFAAGGCLVVYVGMQSTK